MADDIAAGSDHSNQGETNALLSRLRVIEDQPLETRAEAFAQIHDQLRATLEGGDAQQLELAGLMVDQRLDAALAERGIARSRTHAARLIVDGSVTVDGVTVIKPSVKVTEGQLLAVRTIDHYVSRAAHKLLAALDAFELDVSGREALDVGASTGGFTQVLLERGAASVVALDVGHGQLDRIVAIDPRVTVIEGFNARDLSPVALAGAAHRDVHATVVVADLSFISLTQVLPAMVITAEPGADFVVLIKPQFEVGRTGVREGIVRDAGLRSEAVSKVLWSAWDLGLKTAGLIPSPVLGTTGNHEYLAHLVTTSGSDPTPWTDRVFAKQAR